MLFLRLTKELFGIGQSKLRSIPYEHAYTAVGDRTQVSRFCSILALPLRQLSNLIGWPRHLLGVGKLLLGCNRPILYYIVKHSHHLFCVEHWVVTQPEAVTLT